MKFSDYPFIVPNEKQFVKKMEKFVEQLKACDNAKDAAKIINRINAYSEEINTEGCIIYVLYTCYTDNEQYKAAQDKIDELTHENKRFKFILKEAIRTERTDMGRNVLKQLWEAIK